MRNVRKPAAVLATVENDQPDIKAILSATDNPSSFLGKAVFNSNSQFYIGKLASVNKSENTCLIESDLGAKVKKSMNEVMVSVEQSN